MEWRDVVHTAELARPKSVSVPGSFPPQPCSHAAPGAVREEDGWSYGGGGMDGWRGDG